MYILDEDEGFLDVRNVDYGRLKQIVFISPKTFSSFCRTKMISLHMMKMDVDARRWAREEDDGKASYRLE